MRYLIIVSFLFFTSCVQHPDHTSGESVASTEDPTVALYQEVIDIHDEVMPKMEDIYTLKRTLEEKITADQGMAAARKAEIQATIVSLDSANDAMMDWMHKFEPVADSVDREQAREYYESQMESIKKVRDITNETLAKAKQVADRK